METTVISNREYRRRQREQRRLQKQKTHTEFSKVLLIQESILIWIMTLSFIGLAFYCVVNQFFGELPWLAAMVIFPWTAYGVSQGFYYNKSKKENTRDGIKFETALTALTQANNSNNTTTTAPTAEAEYNSGTVINNNSNNTVG